MATPTPLRHPDENNQTQEFYPFTANISRLAVDGSALDSMPIPCAFDGATGGMPQEFQDDAPAMDRLLLQGWHPAITAKARVTLDLFGVRKRFEVADRLPIGQGPDGPMKTLLLVSPID